MLRRLALVLLFIFCLADCASQNQQEEARETGVTQTTECSSFRMRLWLGMSREQCESRLYSKVLFAVCYPVRERYFLGKTNPDSLKEWDTQDEKEALFCDVPFLLGEDGRAICHDNIERWVGWVVKSFTKNDGKTNATCPEALKYR